MSRWAVMAVLVSCTPAPTVITVDAGPMEELGALGAVKLRSELGLVLQNGVPAWGTEFTAEFNALDAQRCTRTIHGPCTFDRCTRLRLADQVTAGRVSFTVNGSRGRSLDPREGSGVYGTSNGFPESWAAGDALVVSAEGGGAGVGPFSVEVAGPGPLVLSAAVMPEVPHDQPLTLKWAPTTSASVGFSLASSDRRLHCAAPGEAGALELPSDALSRFRGSSASMLVGAEALREVRLDGMTVIVHAIRCATVDGKDACGRIQVR